MSGNLPGRIIVMREGSGCDSQALTCAIILCSFLLGYGAFESKGVQAQSLQPTAWQPSLAPLSTETVLDGHDVTASASPFTQERHDAVLPDPVDSPLLSTDWRWVFLPRGVLYHTYWASTAEPRMSTRAINDSGHNFLDSQIGGRIGIVRFGNPDAEEGFQLDLLGGANLRQDTDTYDWDMTGTDYRYDTPLTYRQGPHAWKFGFYHVSSHMGDEFLKYHPSVSRIDYYRDAVYLGYSYYVSPEFRLYGELDYAFGRDYSKPWHVQFGFDWGPVRPTGVRGAPFLALNGHLREELRFSGNVSLQAGWAWKGEGLSAGTLRTGAHFYNGGSPQYSFYRDSEQQYGWGLWYDY